jgi:hypothetical protein
VDDVWDTAIDVDVDDGGDDVDGNGGGPVAGVAVVVGGGEGSFGGGGIARCVEADVTLVGADAIGRLRVAAGRLIGATVGVAITGAGIGVDDDDDGGGGGAAATATATAGVVGGGGGGTGVGGKGGTPPDVDVDAAGADVTLGVALLVAVVPGFNGKRNTFAGAAILTSKGRRVFFLPDVLCTNKETNQSSTNNKYD